MNFLAHLYLSGDDPKIVVGNFIADFVKGRNFSQHFEPGIARGIELHRAIDEYTDQHSIVTESKNRLRPKYRHYSAVIVDVFYDHFLARWWNTYHAQPLLEYTQKMYNVIQEHHAILPEGVKYMLPYMMSGNWLFNYSQTEGIHRALAGMASRTPYKSKMDEAVIELRLYYNEFKNEFNAFFPQLIEHTKKFLHE